MSTIDWACPHGDAIPIEERGQEEVLWIEGVDERGQLTRVRLAPEGCAARNPAFDVTPARYIRAIITQTGVYAPEALPRLATP